MIQRHRHHCALSQAANDSPGTTFSGNFIEAAILCFVYRRCKMQNYIQILPEIVNHSILTHDKNVEEKLAHEMSYQFNFYLSSTFECISSSHLQELNDVTYAIRSICQMILPFLFSLRKVWKCFIACHKNLNNGSQIFMACTIGQYTDK